MISVPTYLSDEDYGISTLADGGCCSDYCEVSECANCEGGDCMTSLDCGNSEGCGTCMYTCESASTEGCDSCESGQGCSESSCSGCEGCESCQSTCQRTCQGFCEANGCQDFCEAGYQKIGIYGSLKNKKPYKVQDIRMNVDTRTSPVLQVYTNINNTPELVYDAIEDITGIAIVANEIFNTDSSGVKDTTVIEKYEWQGELSWDLEKKQLALNNNVETVGSGLGGKLYFKLKDGTYIGSQGLIDILFTYHNFVLEIYNDVSNSTYGLSTIFGRDFVDAETFIFTQDTMTSLDFSLSAWYNANYMSSFKIETAILDGRILSVEFFDRTKELPYYADINNVAEAVIKIDYARVWTVGEQGDNGKYPLSDSIASNAEAFSLWNTTYGSVSINNYSSYSTLTITHNSGSSLNGYALFLEGSTYCKYKNGVYKLIDSSPLFDYFKGTIQINIDAGWSGSAYFVYGGEYGPDKEDMTGTRTYNYPEDLSSADLKCGCGRKTNSGSCYTSCTFYNPILNNIGLTGVSIPTRFEIDPSWLEVTS